MLSKSDDKCHNRPIGGLVWPLIDMSGKAPARKKWTKQTNKEKREWATILTAQQAEDMKKKIPREKVISVGKLAERYKISLTVARKALQDMVADGLIVPVIANGGLHCYGRHPNYVEEKTEVKEEVQQTKKGGKKGGKGKKQ